MDPSNRETSFKNTGAVEQDRPEQKTNVAPLDEQLDHRYQDPLNKASDSGMSGRGQTPEFTGENESNNQLDKDTNVELAPDSAKKLEHSSNAMNKMDRSGAPDSDDADPVDDEINQDPGEEQKENQGDRKDDDLAA
jgi:hypothetical protein